MMEVFVCINLINWFSFEFYLINHLGLDVLGEKWTPNLSIVTSKRNLFDLTTILYYSY